MLVSLLSLAVAFDNSDAMTLALDAVLKGDEQLIRQYITVAGLLEALDRRVADAKKSSLGDSVRVRVKGLIESARKDVSDPNASVAQRKTAVRLLAREQGTMASDVKLLGSLLGLQTSASIQVAAVSHLGKTAAKQVPDVLLSNWKSYTPSIRSEVLNVLTTRGDWVTKLLDGIESKKIA